jgi:hypothetical protein
MFRKRENSVGKRENMSLEERRSFDQTAKGNFFLII